MCVCVYMYTVYIHTTIYSSPTNVSISICQSKYVTYTPVLCNSFFSIQNPHVSFHSKRQSIHYPNQFLLVDHSLTSCQSPTQRQPPHDPSTESTTISPARATPSLPKIPQQTTSSITPDRFSLTIHMDPPY